jgi:hypothetical protein
MGDIYVVALYVIMFDRKSDIFFLYVLWASQMQVGEGELHLEKRHPDYRNEPPNPRLKKSKNKLASPVVRSPMQMASSPGVNMLMRSAALARDSLRVRSASMKRARMAGSPKTSQNSPSLEELSPCTRTTNFHGKISFMCSYITMVG